MEALKHLQNAEAELRKAKPHLLGSDDTQACTEALMVIEILRLKYESPEPKPKAHRHD